MDCSIITFSRGVRPKRWRRPLFGPVLVLTRLSRFRRSTTLFILAASKAIKGPNSFCDNDPNSYNFATAENLEGVKSFGMRFEKILHVVDMPF